MHAAVTEDRPQTAHQRRWLATQHANWGSLHVDQRTLLTALNLILQKSDPLQVRSDQKT
ncbi:hypothetical protein [Streptomyces nigrescens]